MKNVLINRTTVAYRGIVRDLDSANEEMVVESGQAKGIHRVRWDNSTMFKELDRRVTPAALFRGGRVRFEGRLLGNSCLAKTIVILS